MPRPHRRAGRTSALGAGRCGAPGPQRCAQPLGKAGAESLRPSGKPDETSAPAHGRPETAATAPCAVTSASSRFAPSRLRTQERLAEPLPAALSRSLPAARARSSSAQRRTRGTSRHNASIRQGVNHKGQRVKLTVIRMHSELPYEQAEHGRTPNRVK